MREDAHIQVLLVEDSASDAELIDRHIRTSLSGQIDWVTSMGDAERYLAATTVDVVILDPGLPDSQGLDTVRRTVAVAGDAAVVVMTTRTDSHTSIEALDLGVEDYLAKDEVGPESLQRIVTFAIVRRRRQVRVLERALAQFRQTANPAQAAAAPTGDGPLKTARPDRFMYLCDMYKEILQRYVTELTRRSHFPAEALDPLIDGLAAERAGPRDVLDIHVKALDDAIAASSPRRAPYLNTDGRLLVLHVMGMLLTHYRDVVVGDA